MSSTEWTHHAFLQALISRGSITISAAKLLISELFTASSMPFEPEDLEPILETLITTSRRRIAQFDYDIRILVDQTTSEKTYCFVNSTPDPATQLATTFTPDELTFIRRLLDAMFSGNNSQRMEVMALTKDQCLKLGRPLGGRLSQAIQGPGSSQAVDRGITHGDVNRITKDLVSSNWLTHSTAGFYTLSTRALAELRTWLVDTYNDGEPGTWQRIKNCTACKEIITLGMRCAEPECLGRLHDRCAEMIFQTRRGRNCPTCGREWGEGYYVGERAVTEGRIWQQARGGRRRQSRPGREEESDVRLRSMIAEEAEEEDEMSE